MTEEAERKGYHGFLTAETSLRNPDVLTCGGKKTVGLVEATSRNNKAWVVEKDLRVLERKKRKEGFGRKKGT